MPDMRSLIGIDAGVLNQNLSGFGFGLRTKPLCHRAGQFVPLNTSVDVARASDLQLLEAFDRAYIGDNLVGDFAWRTAQLLGQLEG